MSGQGKDPVYQYCRLLSDAEKADLALLFEGRNFGPRVILFVEKHFSEGGKKGEGEADFDETFLNPVEKHRFKQVLLEYALSKTTFTEPTIEGYVRQGKVLFLLEEFGMALGLFLNAMNMVFEAERFEDLLDVLGWVEKCAKKVDADHEELLKWKGMEAKLRDQLEGMEAWATLKRLWYDYVVPFQRARDTQGNVDIQPIGTLRNRLKQLETIFSCRRVEVQFSYTMTFVLLVLGDHHGAMLYNEVVVKTLGRHPWLEEYFPGILTNSLLHGISIRAELKEKKQSYSMLEELGNLAKARRGDLVWRYVFAGLNVAEVFKDRDLNNSIDFLYRTELPTILETASEREQIVILFYLMRNHLMFGQWKNSQHYSYQIKNFKRTEIEQTIQVYSRIIDVAVCWHDGDIIGMKAQIKYFRAFLERLDNPDAFPQAIFAISLFAFDGKYIDQDVGTARLENVRAVLSQRKHEWGWESRYFDLEAYLSEVMIPLKSAQYKHTS